MTLDLGGGRRVSIGELFTSAARSCNGRLPRERRSGEWDWFDQLSPADRRWFGRTHMADVGLRPEDVARTHGFETIDAAMDAVLAAARIDMRRQARADRHRVRPAQRHREAAEVGTG